MLNTITKTVAIPLREMVFCDLFAGTGAVGKTFKPLVKKVIANDVEFYSYVLNKNYINNHKAFTFKEKIKFLNTIDGVEGFIFKEYSQGGAKKRNYFTPQNAKKIDAIRLQIENWKITGKINENEYFFYLASLLESADKVANTASVYGAYLKHIKKSAAKNIIIQPALFEVTKNAHQVYQEDSNKLINQIEGDVLYLDPPYNARQYGANYHLLNTIAKMDTFVPKGVTGLPPYYKSDYCKATKVLDSFKSLIENAKFKYIFLSYNNEGLMTKKEVQKTMEQFGHYDLVTKKYQRFKADKTENRNHKASKTIEYLHILEKQ